MGEQGDSLASFGEDGYLCSVEGAMQNLFKEAAATRNNADWENFIGREQPLYERADDIRSPFARDYTRILHSNAYRWLKHKTQVFFDIDNDHVCTRMEHVAHVESVSCSIAAYMGLNDELTKAIAMGHDLGHAPFGHEGERVLNGLSQKYLGEKFWHERNGLHFVDDVELLEDNNKISRNLDLTYAVRDGIISHCGEIDENVLKPRTQKIQLEREYALPNQFSPYTWEGCVVKIADKIAYVGRDIEDAKSLGFLSKEELDKLRSIGEKYSINAINTTVIIHDLIGDICSASSPDTGITLSSRFSDALKEIKLFNYRYIYANERFNSFQKYCALVIGELFDFFAGYYDGAQTFKRLANADRAELAASFAEFLARYCEADIVPENLLAGFEGGNKKIYQRLQTRELYTRAVLDYVSGMTDRYAVNAFGMLLKF